MLSIPTLHTARLTLEPLSMAHSEGMFRMWRNPLVQRYSGEAVDDQGVRIELPAKTNDESDRLIRFWLQAAEEGWGFRWALLLTEAHTFVGHVGFNALADCSEIAYHLNPEFWGQGMMSEAALAAISWRRKNGATEIEAFVEPANLQSVAMAMRLGMEPTDAHSNGARRYRMSL